MIQYAAVGPAETARQTGINRSTLSAWARKAGVKAPHNELTDRFNSPGKAATGAGNQNKGNDSGEVFNENGGPTAEDDWSKLVRRYENEEAAALKAAAQSRRLGNSMDYNRFMTGAGIARTKLTELGQSRRPAVVTTDPDAIDQLIRAQLVNAAAAVGWVIHPADEPCTGGVHKDHVAGPGNLALVPDSREPVAGVRGLGTGRPHGEYAETGGFPDAALPRPGAGAEEEDDGDGEELT
jgi:transposase-like protein